MDYNLCRSPHSTLVFMGGGDKVVTAVQPRRLRNSESGYTWNDDGSGHVDVENKGSTPPADMGDVGEYKGRTSEVA